MVLYRIFTENKLLSKYKMNANLVFDIATAVNGNSKKWKNKKLNWSEFVKRISEPFYTHETLSEFYNMTKEEQQHIKDVGAYFGGYIRTGRRLKANILHRSMVTLDIDFASPDFWEDFRLYYDCAAICHGSHKHDEAAPRLRLVIPLDREATLDEYTAISRRIAGNLGINQFDSTTFDVNRFMYWQSTPKDVPYYCVEQKGEPLSVDSVLAEYVDWTDINEYPRNKNEKETERTLVSKAENPLEKTGLIGAFCRTYTIHEAIENYLSEQYTRSEHDGARYTFSGGSTYGGAIVYDDVYLYSHHGTDPCSNRLVNSYDLVRLHLFEGSSEQESEKQMFALILKDDEVKQNIAETRLSSAAEDFEGLVFQDDEDESSQALDPKEESKWMIGLQANKSGEYLPTAGNITKIIKNDSRLKEVFKWNMFANRIYIMRSPAWRKVKIPEPMKNVDFSALRNYIEIIYGISSPMKIEDALAIEAFRLKYHPVQNYLNSLIWDGKPRVCEMFQVWLGAEDNEYSSDVAKQFVIGAVSRIFEAGSKFDYVLTLVGEQSAGKSMFAERLGGEWFTDTLMTVKGKEGLEAIQGYWIVEMAELSGLRKADVEAQKHYISKRKDSFRVAYGRVVEDFYRQNVFIATTNDENFLKDMTGNRRFLPIKVSKANQLYHPYNMPKDYIDQIWAEAVQLYKTEGYNDVKDLEANQLQFLELDPRIDLLTEKLDLSIPTDFYERTIDERVAYYTFEDVADESSKSQTIRRFISANEVFAEFFGGDIHKISRQDTRAINDMLRHLGWIKRTELKRVKGYGVLRGYYERPKKEITSKLLNLLRK